MRPASPTPDGLARGVEIEVILVPRRVPTGPGLGPEARDGRLTAAGMRTEHWTEDDERIGWRNWLLTRSASLRRVGSGCANRVPDKRANDADPGYGLGAWPIR